MVYVDFTKLLPQVLADPKRLNILEYIVVRRQMVEIFLTDTIMTTLMHI